jgi:hypothetical protein
VEFGRVRSYVEVPGYRLERGAQLLPQLRRQLTTSLVSAIPHAGLDLAAAQANVLEHVIVHRRELPHVPADA